MGPPGVVDLTRNSIYRKKGSYNSARSNVTCPERSCAGLHSARTADLGYVNMRADNALVSKTVFTIFVPERRTWLITSFPVFDISIHAGNIRDQSLKLSEIAPNFGHYLPSKFQDACPTSAPKGCCPHIFYTCLSMTKAC